MLTGAERYPISAPRWRQLREIPGQVPADASDLQAGAGSYRSFAATHRQLSALRNQVQESWWLCDAKPAGDWLLAGHRQERAAAEGTCAGTRGADWSTSALWLRRPWSSTPTLYKGTCASIRS